MKQPATMPVTTSQTTVCPAETKGSEELTREPELDNAMLRSLLYEAANSLLTVVRRAHPLKDWARRIRKRTSHKKLAR